VQVARDAVGVAVEAFQERQMRPSPQRRLDEVVRTGDCHGQYQKQDFRYWIQNLAMLARIGQRREVTQQRDPDRRSDDEASIDEPPYESNFQPRRKLPLLQAMALGFRVVPVSQQIALNGT
jgi:hypothetical protein